MKTWWNPLGSEGEFCCTVTNHYSYGSPLLQQKYNNNVGADSSDCFYGMTYSQSKSYKRKLIDKWIRFRFNLDDKRHKQWTFSYVIPFTVTKALNFSQSNASKVSIHKIKGKLFGKQFNECIFYWNAIIRIKLTPELTNWWTVASHSNCEQSKDIQIIEFDRLLDIKLRPMFDHYVDV